MNGQNNLSKTIVSNPSTVNWVIGKQAKEINRLMSIGMSLKEYLGEASIFAGPKLGYNDAFLISKDKTKELIDKDPVCVDYIKPILRGREIKKWTVPTNEFNVIVPCKEMPKVLYEHLEQYRKQLDARAGNQKWWEWQQNNSQNLHLMERPKIVYRDMSDDSNFVLDYIGNYILAPGYIIPVEDYHLLGVLNSFTMLKIADNLGTRTGVGTLSWKSFVMDKLPIPPFNQQLEDLVKLQLQGHDKLKEIDSLVEDLYK